MLQYNLIINNSSTTRQQNSDLKSVMTDDLKQQEQQYI
jgi:hypothetical protein